MIQITLLTDVTDAAVASINTLLRQLRMDSGAPDSDKEEIRAIIGQGSLLIVAMDGETIIGMASLHTTRVFGKHIGLVEDVVVDDAYRGQGLGVRLMEDLISRAKESGVNALQLTSRPERIAANKLYQKLGFVQRETNVYKLKL